MIEIAQAHLVLGKEDDMPGMAVGDPALGAQGHHGGVHRLKGMDIQLLLHFFHQPVQDQAADHGVVTGPVMVEFRQAQGTGHNIQLEFIQMGQHILSQDQGIHGSEMIGQPQLGTGSPDKTSVEIGIVRYQHPVPHKFQEFGQDLR